jgi:hypothetical protein
MVWRNTTEIGVGEAVVKTGRHKDQLVIIADYNTFGNYCSEDPY